MISGMECSPCAPKPALPLTASKLSRHLLALHRAESIDQFWRSLLALLETTVPTHSVSLYFNYFEINHGFHVLHHQADGGRPRPWAERRKVSPTPGFLRSHVGQKTFGTGDLSPSRQYLQQVMRTEGWQSLFCSVFWEDRDPRTVLALRKGAAHGTFTRTEMAFLDDLHGHLETILTRLRRNRETGRLPQSLTPCEQDVVHAAIRGFSNAEIARQFGKTEATVKAQLLSVFQKLRIKRRAQLAALMLRG